MVTTTEFTFLSADKKTQIHAIEWKPDVPPVGVLQLVHGMQEFIERYDDFARFMCTKGFLVVGHDHLGHGLSVADENSYGYFAEKSGNRVLLTDMRQLHRMTAEKYPELPFFMMGHSMGSFLARQYICLYGKYLDGAVISGTAYHPPMECKAGMLLCRVIARFKGWKYISKLLTYMVVGSLNKKFEPSATHLDWLTRDDSVVEAYRHDPRTHHFFTLNANYNLFVSLKYLTVRENLMRIPKGLPVLLIAGEMDPVGNFGAGVKKVFVQLQAIGLKDVQCKLYPNDRHEVLNELDKAQVYQDIMGWILGRLKQDKE